MEVHLAPTQPTQVNKVTTSCEICSGPHDTQYCMEYPEQAFVEYASSHTDKAGGKWYTFKPEQNNLGDTYNPSWRSHPNLRTKSYPVGIAKDVEVHIGKPKLLNNFYVINMKKDPETPFLVGRGFLATANAVMDCKIAKIAVGEGITRSVFRVKGVELGRGFLATANAIIDCRMAKIAIGEGITRSVFGVKGVDLDGIGARIPYYAKKDFLDCHLPREWEIARDVELNPFRDTLVFRRVDNIK
nr:MAK10-like protein [Tanacetum cinerariifolium]